MQRNSTWDRFEFNCFEMNFACGWNGDRWSNSWKHIEMNHNIIELQLKCVTGWMVSRNAFHDDENECAPKIQTKLNQTGHKRTMEFRNSVASVLETFDAHAKCAERSQTLTHQLKLQQYSFYVFVCNDLFMFCKMRRAKRKSYEIE